MTDSISDYLTRVRNAIKANHRVVEVPASNLKKEITKTSSTRDITNLFNTIFLGSIITAHLAQQSPLKLFFRRNLDNLMKGLG